MPDLRNVAQGDHICVYYQTDEQRSSVIAEYVKIGLKKNERCLCVAEESVLSEVATVLQADGFDVVRACAHGRLLLQRPREAHLRGGRFDAEGMLKALNDAVEEALDQRFKGLRAVGDMSWILEGAPGTDQLFEYESMMNQFYPTSRAVGLCLYDRRLIDAATLTKALYTHPIVGIPGELFNNSGFNPANQPTVQSDAAFDVAFANAVRNAGHATTDCD